MQATQSGFAQALGVGHLPSAGLLILGAVCLVGGVIQFLCCWLVRASIVRPIRSAARIAPKVAAGDLIGAIAASSQEQSSGIRQVHAAVTQMNQVVQQNAPLVIEVSTATESMNEQASTLLQLVSRLKLEAGRATAEPPRASVRKPVRLRPALTSGAALQPRLT